MFSLNEQLLEPVVRWFRLHSIRPFFSSPLIVADFGCGPHTPLFYWLPDKVVKMYIGIDPLTSTEHIAPHAWRKQGKIESTHLPANSVDRVVMLAVLEHVDDPLVVLQEAHRILKPGGMVLLTTPTPPAKPILEFLSYKLGLISPREIDEHKRYLRLSETLEILRQAGFRQPRGNHFELGLNQLAYGVK